MTFKEFFLEEGMFQIPESVWKNILDYYSDIHQLYEVGQKEKALKSTKQFNLDFSGTRFDSLNKMKPTITVAFTDEKKDSRYESDKDFSKNNGFIYLSLTDPFTRIATYTIEHEVAHFVQDLINKKRLRAKGVLYANPNYKELMGGLPTKGLIPSHVTKTGYLKDEKHKDKRVEHEQTPEEYYPNLITFVRQLQRAYLRYIKGSSELMDNPVEKKNFFMDVYNNGIKRNKDEYETDDKVKIDTAKIAKTKQVSDKLYLKMLSIAYDAFVNHDIASSVKNLEQRQDELNLAIRKARKKSK